MKNIVIKALLIALIILQIGGFLIFLANGCDWNELFPDILNRGTIILLSIAILNLYSKENNNDN